MGHRNRRRRSRSRFGSFEFLELRLKFLAEFVIEFVVVPVLPTQAVAFSSSFPSSALFQSSTGNSSKSSSSSRNSNSAILDRFGSFLSVSPAASFLRLFRPF